MSRPSELGSIKEGSNIVIDGEPCRVVEVEKSKTGKHGSAKVRVVAIGIFDGVKRNIVGPSDQRIEIPVVEKRSGEVVTIGETISVMDRETLEIVELPAPTDEQMRARIEPGANIEYWVVMGRKMISHVRKE